MIRCLPRNWCEDLPAKPAEPAVPETGPGSPQLERVLALVVRLVGELLRPHPTLLSDFNRGLALIRQQCFPTPALK